MDTFDHKAIEKKWQKRWESDNAHAAHDGSDKKKTFLLIEFPYPSGAGLHTGHVRSYTALDVIARKRRREGENVLYPIGWDAFGLPTENYAIKTGRNPRDVTKENTDTFRRQLKSLGISFDWSREVNTTDPGYYKWTQWIFIQLFKKGLAYKAKTLINWCPKDKIGLANEEVVDGACERCGIQVEKREKEQWMLAITKYAQRLYDDLDTVDYIERAKIQQRNWIGPSEGAEIDFAIKDFEKKIAVFTTRADTLFGATYLVLAPEHELVSLFKKKASNEKEIDAYIASAKQKTDIERLAENKEKTGVELKGIKAINSANNEEIPIFIADYVLSGYGTGAIMAVPAHDERDFAFAKKFTVPVRYVIMPHVIDKKTPPVPGKKTAPPRRTIHALVLDKKTGKFLGLRWKKFPWTTFVVGGVEDGEDVVEAAKREVAEETGYSNLRFVKFLGGPVTAEYFAAHKDENRVAITSGLLFELADTARAEITEEELQKHDVVWLDRNEITEENMTCAELPYWLANLNDDIAYAGDGVLIDSGDFNNLQSEEAKRKITEFVGGKIVTKYKLRDWVFSRQRYWGEPIPMVHCEKDGWVPVPESELPIQLPEVEKYEPTDTGESPLAAMTGWVSTTCPVCGADAKRETDVMPNWAGSSWYYLRYTDPKNNTVLADSGRLKYWTPVDWYNGGMEHTVLHLLYSRFWHKFLYDIGVVPTSEPYKKRTSHGLILAEGGEKMSKSKGNVVNPDEINERFGADALRVYEMFMGPFEQAIAWSTDGLVGAKRFLERVYKLHAAVVEEPCDEKLAQLMHQTIKKVTEDIESLKMNTALSQLMIFSNELGKLKHVPTSAYDTLIQLLAPFAPHVTEELWEMLGHTDLIHSQTWPVFDASILKQVPVIIAVQVNGKMRDTLTVQAGAEQVNIEAQAKALPAVAKHTAEKTIKKTIFVQDKAINFVVG